MAPLKVSPGDAKDMLARHIADGQTLLGDAGLVSTTAAYEDWEERIARWIKLTVEALRCTYDGQETAGDFERAASSWRGGVISEGWTQEIRRKHKVVKSSLNELKSLEEQLSYASPPAASIPTLAPVATPSDVGDGVVFLVHGRDHGTRDAVALFLQNAGPPGEKPVILDELANKGRTLVEKLEQHASGSRYAVVLLTGDDVGGLKDGDPTEQRLRARQNVILELGWFCGLIGRENVAVLHEADIETPSDIGGLAYISLGGDWKTQLVQELSEAGHDFSLDRPHGRR